MKTLSIILIMLCLTLNANAFGGDHIKVRLHEHLEFKRLSNHHNQTFDSIEITAFLTNSDPVFYPDIPDTIHYNATINGRQLVFNDKHKIIISEPGNLWLGYYDSWIQDGATQYYNVNNSNRFFCNSNVDFPNNWNSYMYYLKPNFKAFTNYYWNKIQVGIKYNGAVPKPNGSYCFGNDIKTGLRDDSNYYVERVNWYQNGNLLSETDSIYSITAPGVYHAEIISNFGYKYYSDTISISTYQFAQYTDCIDAQILANYESKITGKKEFENVIHKKLNIYPNPVTDFIELHFKICNEVNASFELYNLSGLRILQRMYHFYKDESSHVQLDLTDVSPGLYVLCFDFNGIKKRTKIIKQ